MKTWREKWDFFFVYLVKARMRANTAHSKGGMRQEGQDWEGQNSGEQRHYDICGRERDGVGNMGYTRWTPQGLSGRKARNLKEVGLGWINRGRKDRGFG